MPWRCTAWGRLALSPGLPTRSRAGADASPEWIPTRSQSAAMSCTGAKSYVGHALEMYGMGPPGFVTRFANEIARWSRCFPGMDTDEVAESSHELRRRQEVRGSCPGDVRHGAAWLCHPVCQRDRALEPMLPRNGYRRGRRAQP